jgi:hypothetical protein
VLFRTRVQCPPLITYLAQLRANSTYAPFTTPLRFSIGQYLAAFPAAAASPATATLPTLQELTQLTPPQLALLEANARGDASSRVNVLATGFLANQGASFAHAPMAHYAACAPASCSFFEVAQRSTAKLAFEAVSTFGGNGAATMSIMGMGVAWLAFFGRRWDQWHKSPQQKREEKAAAAAAAAAAEAGAEVGGLCNCPHCPCQLGGKEASAHASSGSSVSVAVVANPASHSALEMTRAVAWGEGRKGSSGASSPSG